MVINQTLQGYGETMTMVSAHFKPWIPDRPVSKGATAYHEAVVNSSWHIENIRELINIIQNKIKNNDIVVDFGAGTGGSALYLLKNLKVNFNLWLVDNSAAWLGKAHDVLGANPNVKCFLLDKINDKYATLAETIGKEVADHVISANTVHLIPNLEEAFRGINESLKPEGSFTFQSGNIIRNGREQGILMIDDTVKRVHDIALEIILKNNKFEKYRNDLNKRIEIEEKQRKFVFPDPRPIETYMGMLKVAGFKCEKPQYKLIKVKYSDWLNFVRVKRLQAGILPEVGGKEPSQEEEQDRDELIAMASNQLFKELETGNPFADDKCFTAEWIYITAIKQR